MMSYLSRDPGVIVRIRAESVRVWDYADIDLMPPTASCYHDPGPFASRGGRAGARPPAIRPLGGA